MRNFNDRFNSMNMLFTNKFKLYDSKNSNLKIYYISPDNNNIYMNISPIVDSDKLHICELGDLYFNEKKKIVFEDNPAKKILLNETEFKMFKNYFNDLSFWSNDFIIEIINQYKKIDIDLVL